MGSSTKTQDQHQNDCRQRKATKKRGPSHAGPYKLACVNCFKAKSKCVAVSAAAEIIACRRCRRLGKPCQPSDSIRRRGAEKKLDSSRCRIEELESKVESLSTQLRSPRGAGLVGLARESPTDELVLPSIEVDTGGQNDLKDFEADKMTSHKSRNDFFLDKFRWQMLPNFPFMHLPATITA